MATSQYFLARHRWRVIAVAVIVAITAVAGVLFWRRQQPVPSVVNQQGEDPQFDSEDGLARVPPNAKSETCSRISAKAVEKALGYKTHGAKVSIPTKKTADATVSACAYVAQQKDKVPITSVLITSRVFIKDGKAQESFELLNKVNTTSARKLDLQHTYDPAARQIVAFNQNTLLTLSYMDNSKNTINQNVIQNLAALLK